MTRARRLSPGVVLLVAGWAVLSAPGMAARQPNVDAQYLEARQLFDGLDYENALIALDGLVAALEAVSPLDEVSRQRLASALEMRARSKFGLGDQAGAKDDFVALLRVAPSHDLTGQVSPRVVSLFEETVAETMTTVMLAVSPPTARVYVDGAPITATGEVRIPIGSHEITAEQRGYRTARDTITAAAGEPTAVTLTLERVSAVLHILTSPPGVDVTLNGSKVGTTEPGPPSSQYADAIVQAGAPPGSVSAAFLVDEVKPGTHVIELTRECSVSATSRLVVERPDDYTVGPITLAPAMATLTVQANEPGAQVVINGRERGAVPVTVNDLCEGSHVVELRSRFGRDVRRIEARAGETITVDGVLKPAFAVVSVSGEAGTIDPELPLIVERVLAGSQGVAVIAVSADESEKLLKASQLSSGWLAVDADGRPLGTAAQLARTGRSEASSKLAEHFGTQGVASVTVLEGGRTMLALLAAGSGTPDVIEVRLDRQDSIAAAIERLDRVPGLTRPSIGLLAIDVADLAGPVVVSVDANGPAAAARVQPGDIVLTANGQPVSDAAALAQLVAGQQPGQPLRVELRDAAGATKVAELSVFETPRLIGLNDQTVLVNRVLLDLRTRLAGTTDPFQEAVIRLNTAVALVRTGDCNGARDALRQVKLPDRPGVGNGTVQYLLGLCAAELGHRADAEAAFKAAAASDSLLTEDGPPVRELAETRLAELQRPSAR